MVEFEGCDSDGLSSGLNDLAVAGGFQFNNGITLKGLANELR